MTIWCIVIVSCWSVVLGAAEGERATQRCLIWGAAEFIVTHHVPKERPQSVDARWPETQGSMPKFGLYLVHRVCRFRSFCIFVSWVKFVALGYGW